MGEGEEVFEVVESGNLIGSEGGIGDRPTLNAELKGVCKCIFRVAGSAVALRVVVDWMIEGDPKVKASLGVIVRVHGNAEDFVSEAHLTAIRTVSEVDLELSHENTLIWSIECHCHLAADVIV